MKLDKRGMWVEQTFLTLLLVLTGMADIGPAEDRNVELPFHKLNDRLILQRGHLRTTSNVLSGGLSYQGKGVK